MNKTKRFLALMLTLSMVLQTTVQGFSAESLKDFSDDLPKTEAQAENTSSKTEAQTGEAASDAKAQQDELSAQDTDVKSLEGTSEDKSEEISDDVQNADTNGIIEDLTDSAPELAPAIPSINDAAPYRECIVLNDGALSVQIEAETGVFPDQNRVEAKLIDASDDSYVSLKEALAVLRDESSEAVLTCIVDLTAYDQDGNEIQPNGTVSVLFGVQADPAPEKEIDTSVYHFRKDQTTETLKAEILGSDESMPGAALIVKTETNGFSPFALDLTIEKETAPVEPSDDQKNDQQNDQNDTNDETEQQMIPDDLSDDPQIMPASGSEEDDTVIPDDDVPVLFTARDASSSGSGKGSQNNSGIIYCYDIKSGKSVSIVNDIIPWLQDNAGFPDPFDFLTAMTDTQGAGIDNLFNLSVPGGGVDVDLKVYNKDNEEYTIYVTGPHEVVLKEIYTDPKFTVRWNDNGGNDSECADPHRPKPEDITLQNEWYKLYFSIDGGQQYSISELLEKTGLSAADIGFDPVNDKDIVVKSLNASENISAWIFDFTKPIEGKNIKLPKTYEADGQTHTITYVIEQKDPTDDTKTQFPGYMPNTGSNIIPLGGEIKNTAAAKYEGYIYWGDEEDKHNTRPSLTKDDFDVYRTTETSTPTTDFPKESMEFTITPKGYTDPVTGKTYDKITITGLPAFMDNGTPATYSCKLKDSVTPIKPKAGQTIGNDLIYLSEYENKGNYSANTEAVYNNGVLTNYLNLETSFSFTKEWRPQNAQDKPTAMMYLYVVAEKDILASGTFDPTTASAVTGYSAVKVPTVDGKVDLKDKLPMFNKEGEKLVYFALETDIGTYQRIIDNSASSEDADVVIEIDKLGKYVLNNGTIRNVKSDTTIAKAEVTMHMAVLQNETASATLALERYDNAAKKWVPVHYQDYLNYPDTGSDQYKNNYIVSEIVNGFRAENTTEKLDSYLLPKYDSDGEEILYRWQQIGIYVQGGNKIGHTEKLGQADTEIPNALGWNNDVTEYDDKDLGKIVPGANNQKVDLFVNGTATKPDTKEQKTKIDNYINAPTYVFVKKQWFDNGVNVTDQMPASAYVKFSVTADGVQKEEITVDKASLWQKLLTDLDRFNEKGGEINYDIKETAFFDGTSQSGWGQSVAYSNKNVRNLDNPATQVKETDITITNTKSVGPGKGIELTCKKEWKDGSDVNSRLSVYMGLFCFDADPNDSIAVPCGLIDVAELNDTNSWYDIKRVSEGSPYYHWNGMSWVQQGTITAEQLDAANFVFIELGIGNPSQYIGYCDMERAMYFSGFNFGSWGQNEIAAMAGIANQKDYGSQVGMIADDNVDPFGKSPYTYLTYAKKTTDIIGRTCYSWKNVRTALVNYDLTKVWKDGGTARSGKFALYRNGALYDEFTTETDGTNLKGSINQTPYSVTTSQVPQTPGSIEKKLVISNLPKYDAEGELYNYLITEIQIKDDNGNWVPLNSGTATVSGVRYASSCDIDASKGTGGTVPGPIHHNGDLTYWKAENSVYGTNKLTFNKVWYDNGIVVERPLVSFSVYRISSNASVKSTAGNKNLIDYVNQYRQGGSYTVTDLLDTIIKDFSKEAKLVTEVKSDRLYNAKPYYWGIDIGEQQLYDENGYPYIYYACENGTAGSRYTVFCGNMTAQELYPDSTKSQPSDIYDIYPNGYYDKYAGETYLMLSDGFNKVSDDPFAYFSKTFVNMKADNTTLTGRKLWKLPDNWTADEAELPQVKLAIYRSTTKLVEPGQNYDQAKFNSWMSTTSPTPEKVCEVTLNKKNGITDKDHEFKTYSYNVAVDAAGKPLPKYDGYGNNYYYYVIETPAKDSQGVDLPYQIKGYPLDQVQYNTNSLYTENAYSLKEPWVKISGTKAWSIDPVLTAGMTDAQIQAMLKTLASVTVTLYAMPADENGQDLPGSSLIRIAERKLDPNDIQATFDSSTGIWTLNLAYLFDVYEFYSKPNQKIPYYGPNGEPFNFYLTESVVSGYTEKVKNKNDSGWNPVTYTTLQKVAMNANPVNDVYENTNNITEFSNQYSEKTNFEPKKIWNDGYVDNSVYRPDRLSFVVRRSTINGTDPNFNVTVTFEKTFKNNVNDNSKSNTWVLSDTEKAKLQNLPKYDTQGYLYTYYVESEYITSPGQAAKNVGDPVGSNYKLSTDLTQNNKKDVTNTLNNQVSASLDKRWMYNATDGTQKLLPWDQFIRLRAMGGLPIQVDYVLMRTADGSTYETIPAAADKTDVHKITFTDESGGVHQDVLGYSVNIKDMTANDYVKQFNLMEERNTMVTWNNLPEKNSAGAAYSYKIVEYMTWQKTDGITTETIKYDVLTSKKGVKATITPELKNDNWKTKAVNEIDNYLVVLRKDWVDDRNKDNTRPATLDMTITAPGGESFIFNLSTNGQQPVQIGSEWYSYYESERFYLPGTVDITDPATFRSTGTYKVTEAKITSGNYTYNEATDLTVEKLTGTDNVSYYAITLKNTLNQNRKGITVEAKKTWSGDDAWKDITRPTIKYTLQYKTQRTYDATAKKYTDGTWTNFDTTNPDEGRTASLVLDGKPNQPAVVTRAYSSTTQYPYKWENLKKYWDDPCVDGVPDIIEYRVVETIITNNSTNQNSYTTTYKAPSTATAKSGNNMSWTFIEKTNAYEGSFINTLSKRTLAITKTWTASDGTTQANLTNADVKKLVGLGALPELLQFEIEYSADGGTTWANVPVKPTVGEKKDTNSVVWLKTEAFADLANNRISLSGIAVPRYANDGIEIQYRIRETAVKYKNSSNWISVSYDTAGKGTSQDNNIEVGQAVLKGSAANAALTNDYQYVSVSVKKNWIDENNRDGKRDDFKVTLYRDTAVYGTADVSTGDMSSVFGTVDKTQDANGNWTIIWNYLPRYKADGTASVYTWQETVTTTDYDKDNPAGQLTPATEEFNSYQPLRGDIEVTKNWDPTTANDIFKANAEEVYVQLQYYDEGTKTWQPVTYAELKTLDHAGTKTYYYDTVNQNWLDVSKAYTDKQYPDPAALASEPTWVKLTASADAAKSWKYVWTNLPVYKRVGTATSKLKYRVIEGLPTYDNLGNLTRIDAINNNNKLNGFKVTYSPVEATFADTPAKLTPTVKNQLEKSSLDIGKVWANDAAVKSEVRPDSVTFLVEYKKSSEDDSADPSVWKPLPAGLENVTYGTDGKSYIVVTKANRDAADTTWSKKINDLPVKDAYGNTYQYRVTEEKITYPAPIGDVTVRTEGTDKYFGPYKAADIESTRTLTLGQTTYTRATNTLETGSYAADKVWNNNNDRDGARAEVKAQLQRTTDAVPAPTIADYRESQALNSGNQWHTDWASLPIYTNDGQHKYVYSVKEVGENAGSITIGGKGYDVAYTTAQGDPTTVTITNTHIPEVLTITAQKDWNDNNDEWGIRPDNVTFHLEYSLDGTTWTDFDDANIIRSADLSDLLGNTIDETKVYMVNTDTAQKGKQTIAQNGTAAWTNLTAYAVDKVTDPNHPVSKKVQFRVVEDPVDINYQVTKVTPETVNIDSTNKSVEIQNTPVYGKIEVTKKVTENGTDVTGNDLDTLINKGILPNTFTVKLYRGTDAAPCRTGTFTYDSGTKAYSKATFTDLPVYLKESTVKYQYKVTDAADTQYQYIECGTTTGIQLTSGTTPSTADITNNFNVGSLKIEKEWNDENDRDQYRSTKVEIKLYKVKAGTETADKLIDTVELDNSNNWNYTWNELLVKNYDQTDAYYYVVETPVNNYTTTYNAMAAPVSAKLKPSKTGEPLAKIDILNVHTPDKGRIAVGKEWKDNGDPMSLRPADITVKLQYKIGTAGTWTDITKSTLDTKGNYADDGVYTTSDPSQKLKKSEKWIGKVWEDLPYTVQGETVSYKVVEDAVTNYITSYSPTETVPSDPGAAVQNTITVTNKLDEGSLTVTKVWNPGADVLKKFNHLPQSITVQLQYQDEQGVWQDVAATAGKAVIKPDAKGEFRHTFDNISKDDAWRAIETQITYAEGTLNVVYNGGDKENGTVGNFTYSASTTKSGNSFATTITNSLPASELEVTKTWNDEDDRDILRNTLTVNLYRDKVLVDTVSLKKDTTPAWYYKWTNLPMYKNGSTTVESVYRIEEIQNTGYVDPKYSTNNVVLTADVNHPYGYAEVDITNIRKPVKGKASVIKKWEDYSDHYGLRPAQIYVTLKYKVDGVDTTWKTITKSTLDTEGNYADGGVHTTSVVIQKIDTIFRSYGNQQIRTWFDLPITVNYNGVSKNVIYKVFETDQSGADITRAELKHYEITYSSKDGEALTAPGYAAEQTVTNTLDTTSLALGKKWTDDLKAYTRDGLHTTAALVRPVRIDFLIEYSTDGGITWSNLDPAGQSSVCQNGIVTLTGAANAASWGPITLTDLPKKAADGSQILYRAQEAKIYYSDQTTWTPHTKSFAGGVWSGYAGNYDASVKTTFSPAGQGSLGNDTWTAEAENKARVLSLSVKKEWNDGQNRDNVRPGQIYLALHMVDYDPNGSELDTVIDRITLNSAPDNWTYTWDNIPVYSRYDEYTKVPAGHEMLYYVAETDQNGNELKNSKYKAVYSFGSKTSSKPDETAGSLYSGSSVVITNTYEPLRFTMEADKVWDDNKDFYGLRPKDITFTLEATTDDPTDKNAVWKPVVHVNTVPAPDKDDGDLIYTTSDVTQTIDGKNQKDPSVWSKAEWKDLPANVKQGKPVSYRAVETVIPTGYQSSGHSDAVSYDSAKPVQHAEVTNTTVKADIGFVKVDKTDQTKTIAGAQYGLYWKEGNNWNQLKTFTTDANGEAYLDELATEVTYQIRELKGVDGYYVPTQYLTIRFTVKNGKTVIDSVDDGNGTCRVADGKAGGPLVHITWLEPRTEVTIEKKDANGNGLVGAVLTVRKENESPLARWISDGKPHVIESLVVGQEYILSEMSAPSGYHVAADIRFVVPADGKITLTMTDKPVDPAKENGKINVTKVVELYGVPTAPQNQVYYTALFSDEAMTQRVSDVKAIQVSGQYHSTVTFENLDPSLVYYVAETNEQGIRIGTTSQIKVTVTNQKQQLKAPAYTGSATITNDYQTDILGIHDKGAGTITVQKEVTYKKNQVKVTDTFYAALFEDPDYQIRVSGIKEIKLSDKSSKSVSFTDLASGTYYVTETDKNGNPVTNNKKFNYVLTVKNGKVEISGASRKTVTLRNELKKYTPKDTKGDNRSQDNGTANAVRTGDRTPLLSWIGLMLISALGILLLFRRRRRYI